MALSSKQRDRINRRGLMVGRKMLNNVRMGNLLAKMDAMFGSSSYTAPNLAINANNASGAMFDATGSDVTTIFKLVDTKGATVGAMFKNPTLDAPAGHMDIAIGATVYQIPFYASS